eukprot:CAMPEP_0183736096 /NCGR_PEP_ID=MMETSP0737-20130205/48474_1 /TAXON_ID=385413 /ORGANISM="Thalassiosira miniscula, Strain CCMP1093" /LENGTH=264 /DNA_ID=CAMNT_0025970015 /DNA_START=105 /DNA_END=896 /DNA_ORIENTATION=+
MSTTSNSRRLFVAAAFTIITVLCWEWELRQMFDGNPLPYTPTPTATLPACTKESPDWPNPETIPQRKYERAAQALEVLGFIISKLDEIGGPVIPMFGSALHEYRNGTDGPCLIPDYKDKDFDIALFADHYWYITTFATEVLAKFGWEFMINERRRGLIYTTIKAVGEQEGSNFQIDIYGFLCNKTSDHIYFPWDKVTIARNSFLPVRKHKLILEGTEVVKPNRTSTIWNRPGFYMPYDPPCLLENIYGSDYMTPKSGASSQAKW